MDIGLPAGDCIATRASVKLLMQELTTKSSNSTGIKMPAAHAC